MNRLASFRQKIRSLSVPYSILFIVLLYIFIYALSLLTGVSDVEFMGVDERSIMTSLHGLFSGPLYNMTEQYHSKAYGWTYFSINFLVISPLKLLQVDNDFVYNVVVRATLFVIGILVGVAFYLVSIRFLSRLASLVLAILFLLDPVASHYFVTIHPETTGMLFYLGGVYFVFKYFSEGQEKLKIYIIALTCFWLSSLSKQPFAITSVVTILLFPLYYLVNGSVSARGYLLKKSTWNTFFLSVFVVVTLLFVVNPYAILNFSAFLEGQMGPLSHSEGRPLEEAVLLWWNQLKESPVVLANFLLLLLLPFYKTLKLSSLFVFSVLASCVVSVLFMYMQKLIVSMTYIYPLFPVFLWNTAYALKLFLGRIEKNTYLSVATVCFLMVVVGPYFLLHAIQSVYRIHAHFLLEEKYTTHVVYSYIEELPSTEKLLYMPTIAMPKTHKHNSCHVWRSCNTEQAIKKFQPDYIFVNWRYPYFEPEIIKTYMKNEPYELVHQISGGGDLSLNCGLPDYLMAPKSTDELANDGVSEGLSLLSEFGVLENFSIVSMGNRIGNCIDSFQGIYDTDQVSESLGDDIEVWKKVERY